MRPRTLSDWLFPRPRKYTARQLGSAFGRYLDRLEERLAPAVRIWTGLGADDLWSNAANWDTGVPVDNDDVCIAATVDSAEVLFDTSVAGGGVIVNSLTSDGANPVGEPFRITGDTLTLTGAGPFAFGDSLLLAAGTLTVTGTVQVTQAMNFTGGTLSGTGDVTIAGLFTWSNGSMNGSGRTFANGGIDFNMSGLDRMVGWRLDNAGLATWTGTGDLTFQQGAVFNNNGTFDVQNDRGVFLGGGVATFNNNGTFRKTAGSASTNIGIAFNNAGNVDLQTGTVRFDDGGTSTGAWTVATPAVLHLGAGTHNLNAGSTVSGNGTARLSGSVNLADTYSVSLTEITGGVVNFNTNSSTSTLALGAGGNGGRLVGAGNFTVTGALTWNSGNMEGTGTTFANGGISLTGSVRMVGRRVDNAGLATWTNNGDLTLQQGAVFNNNGTFDIQNNRTVFNGGGTLAVLNNNGTFKKSAGTAATTWGVGFTNNGTVDVQTGAVSFTGAVTNLSGGTLTGGTWIVRDNATLNTPANVTTNQANVTLDGVNSLFPTFDAIATNGASGNFTIQNGRNFNPSVAFNNAGNVFIGAGSTFTLSNGGSSTGDWAIGATGEVKFTAGTPYLLDDGTDITGAGLANIVGGTVNAGDAAADFVNAERIKLTSGGVLQGAGTLAVSAKLNWDAGTMAGSGTTTIMNGATATIVAGGDVFLGRTLVNQGNIDFIGGINFNFGVSGSPATGVLNNNGVFNATGSGVIKRQGASQSTSHAFNNAGTFNRSGLNQTQIIGVQFNNSGSADVQAGALELLGGGNSSGSFDVAGATLRLAGSTTFTNTSSLTGAGTAEFTVGSTSSTTVDGMLAVDALKLTTGTVNLNTNTTLSNLELSGTGGTLQGSGSIDVTGSLVWGQGTMTGSGTTTILNGATATLSGGGDKFLARTLDNRGTVNQSGINFIFGVNASPATGVFDNNGTFNSAGDITKKVGSVSTSHTFNNGGTFNRVGAGTTAIAGIQFSNSGTINVLAGGTLDLASGLGNFGGATLTGGVFDIAGTLKFTGANIVTNAATIVLDGPAAQIVNQSNVDALANFASNAAAGSFTILNGHDFTTTGTFSNAGNLTIASGSTLSTAANNYTQTNGETTLKGELTAATVDIQGGVLQGGPGAPTDFLRINGNYTQASTASLSIEIGGLTAGTDFDQLVVSGSAALDGTVNVTRLGGFVPAAPDNFRIVSAASRNGAFATVNGLFPGGRLAPLYDATGAVLDANLNPTPDNDADTTLEDHAVTTNVVDNDSDPEADPLSVVAVGTSTQGITPVINGDNTISYSPPANFFGSDSFTYTVRDVVGNEATATVTIDVTPVNDTPTLDSIVDPTILEDAGTQTVNLTGITAGPNESQFLTVSAVSDNAGLIPNPTVSYTSPEATGSLSFTPVANQFGTATITVTVTDDGGTADSGVNTFSRTFVVSVTPVNDAPTLDPISDPPPVEGASPQTVNLTGITAGTNESQTLTVTAISSNPGLIPDPVVTYTSPDATGSLEITPVANQAGQATITVTVTDNGGTDNGGISTFSRTFTVTAINDAPTLDAISDGTILEDAGEQTINLTGISAGGGESQTLVVTATSSNPGLIPNPTIDYTSPNASSSLHFTPLSNQHGSAVITVKVKDNGGTALGGVDEITRTFIVNVDPVPDAPIIDTTPIQMLPALPLKPVPTDPDGAPVSELLDGVTEVDGEPLGIAITGIDNLKGKWQYSVDGGTNWQPIPVDVAATAALVLIDEVQTRVRFLPNKGFQGFSSFFYKAWDQSDGELNEARVDTTLEPTAYSSAIERVWVAVGKTNPVVNGEGATVLSAVKEDSKFSRTFAVKGLLGIAGLEQAPATNLGMAITSASTASGKWQFRLAKSKLFVDVGSVSEASALLLRAIDTLRFVPNANADGQADLTFKTWNQVGTPGDKVDTAGAGFGIDPGLAVIDITALNDAPVLDLSVAAVLDPIDPGQTTNEPTFASLMSANDVEGATLGVAVVAAKGTGWEFNTGNGWTPLGVVSMGKALLLSTTDRVRFVAPATTLPGTATLSFKAWDQFPGSGVAGSRVPIRGTAFSKQTEIATVAIDNDAPVLNTTPDVTLPNVLATSTKPIAGTLVKTLLGTAMTDTPKSLKGIAITFADNTNGKWQYSLGGNVFVDIGTVSADAALLLTDVNKLRFVPNAGFTGQATIQYKAWDRTAGQANDRIDTDSGFNSFSLEVETATVTVV